MGKAFQCDNCLECFPGDAYIIGEKELCGGCKRALEALGCIDELLYTNSGFYLARKNVGTSSLKDIARRKEIIERITKREGHGERHSTPIGYFDLGDEFNA